MTPPLLGSISRRDLLWTSFNVSHIALHTAQSMYQQYIELDCISGWHVVHSAKNTVCTVHSVQSAQCIVCRPVPGTLRRSNLIREQKRGRGTAGKCNKQVVEEDKWSYHNERPEGRRWRLKCSLRAFPAAFHFAKGCELNLIRDLRLRRAVFEKESLGLPPIRRANAPISQPHYNIANSGKVQPGSSAVRSTMRRKRGLTNCRGAGKQQAGALKRGLGKVELGRRSLSEKP